MNSTLCPTSLYSYHFHQALERETRSTIVSALQVLRIFRLVLLMPFPPHMLDQGNACHMAELCFVVRVNTECQLCLVFKKILKKRDLSAFL